MIDARFVPVDVWPGKQTPSYAQKASPFQATYVRTLYLLETELNHLRAKDILIQAYFDRADIRNDGWPRSSARPKQNGVIVTFERNKQTMSFPCDTFKGWEDNLRAIALALEALRKIDRYGVTRNNEQYRGFAQLPAASNSTISHAGALAFFSKVTGWTENQILADTDGAYRAAAAVLHPDKGGNHEVFVLLGDHKKALKGSEAAK